MYKNLPETLLIERSMMHRMECSGAILQYLPQFLQTLARTKETALSLELLEADLKRQQQVQQQEMAKSIEWIAEKIGKLKTSPFAKHPLVEHTIERAERSKDSKDKLPPAILLNSIIVNLQLAVSSIAAFGNDPLFEGWAEIEIARKNPKGIAPKFPKQSKGLIQIKNRWELAEQMGHGVDCWQVTPLTTSPDAKQSIDPAITLLYGYCEKFTFPPCVDAVFYRKGSKGLQRWREERDSNAATLLGFLKILSQYTLCKSTSEPFFLRPKTIQEAEELCIQGEIRPYLCQFSLINPEDHPLSRSQLLNLIDTFLNMVEVQITQQSARRQIMNAPVAKKDVRVEDKKIAEEWMRNEWLKDCQVAQETIVDRLLRAIIDDKIDLKKEYERSTFLTWARHVDPLPKTERVYRLKTKNVKK